MRHCWKGGVFSPIGLCRCLGCWRQQTLQIRDSSVPEYIEGILEGSSDSKAIRFYGTDRREPHLT